MDLTIVAPITSIVALAFTACLTFTILKKSRGTKEMKEISDAIARGAKEFLKKQYTAVAIFLICMACFLAFLVHLGYLNPFVPLAFLTGGFFSALAGYIGITLSTKSNARTAQAVKKSLNEGLRIALFGGAGMGLAAVGLALLDLSFWFYFLKWYYGYLALDVMIAVITGAMVTFELGASSVALFARVGGGIYTKAADVGADLVGKVEEGIPEDDPRNPAVIADQVGDNVGDVAGMGADLYESYVGSIVGTMLLAYAAGFSLGGVTLPLVLASVGVLSSIVGIISIRTRGRESPVALIWAIRRGIYLSAILIAILSFFVVRHALGMEHIGVFFAVLAGLAAGLIMGLNTEYFTSSGYSPAKSVSESSRTGPSTVIISGLTQGMSSTFVPIIAIAGAISASYFLSGGATDPSLGLYGVGISAVGMLSTLGITLTTDAYGPISDNAGGIAEITHQKPVVRKRTDALDDVGNTTAATGKGFAIGSAGLTALALIAAYNDKIVEVTGGQIELSIMDPKLLIGLFLGSMIVFVFCSLTMRAVGKGGERVVIEARRQFKEIKGLREGKAEADYTRCVGITTRAAQRQMVAPAMTAIVAPIIVGLLIGPEAVIGLLIGALCTGFPMAIFMANTGGVWDNAKKRIEFGEYGGKGSESHKASVIGDTVGDPFKDTSGPSLNILIKLMSMVSIVFASFIIPHCLF
ncbi:MAG: sodium-translocating pyrophosphatase [Candidatus Hadarchaeota archaeon]|nr:sodium-translocating pyrophosphatase [Candidatus Hadarchaeota archaeon]